MANSSIRTLIRDFCGEYGLPLPNTVTDNSDDGIVQMVRILQRVGEEVRERSNWQEVCRRVEWNAVANENQGALTDLFVEAFDYLIPRTFWNHSLRQPIHGPIGDTLVQSARDLNPAGPAYQFYIAEGNLYVIPTLTAGDDLSAIYKSKYWIRQEDPAQWLLRWTNDTDVSVFSDEIMRAGLEWRWRRLKEMPYQEERAQYEALIMNAASRNSGGRPIVRIDGPGMDPRPGIVIPSGNWLQP